MPDEIRPALTAEEWRKALHPEFEEGEEGNDGPLTGIGIGYTSGRFPGGGLHNPFTPHAMSALCLHAQPFGFTWEDVDELRSIAAGFEAELDNTPGGVDHPLYERQLWVESLANRIAALLPPREGTDDE